MSEQVNNQQPNNRLEVITPEIATCYLTRNTKNRGEKLSRIASYAESMRIGQWVLNGETIKFGKSTTPEADDGRLLDGQNRLKAVIMAGVPIEMFVTRGLDEQVQETIDTANPRSLADVLKMRGEKSVHSLAATLRALYAWDAADDPEKRTMGHLRGKYVSNTALLQYFDENPSALRYLANRVDAYRRTTTLPNSVLAPIVRETENI